MDNNNNDHNNDNNDHHDDNVVVVPAFPRIGAPFNFGLSCNTSSIPLKHVAVSCTVLDFLAEVTLEQSFTNTDTEAIEAVYRFPLDAQAVLKSFSVDINGKTIQGEVEEKQAAADTYDDALASGHGGFLLNQDAETKDIFSLRVGNLPPKASVTIRLSYVTQIDEELWLTAEGKPEGGSVLRLVIPTAVAPRYHPATDQPPELYQHAEAALAKWPADLLKIEGKIKTASPITELRPHTYKDETTTTTLSLKEATFRMQVGSLTEDFVLSIHLESRLADRAWLEPATGALTVSAGLKPGQFEFANESTGEFIFVIDRSGSMAGTNIKQAREALALCVSALPVGSTFQIIGFGHAHTTLFPSSSAPFDDARKTEALEHCKTLEADMGGTEILGPLRALVEKAPDPTKPRQVLVITDGQVGNTSEVIDFVRKDHRQTGTRYFSFGIGAGASRALVKGIAEAGGGFEEFIVEGERLQGKIMRQMNRALEPSLTHVTLHIPPSFQLLGSVSPKAPRPMFTGSRLLFYALLDPASIKLGEGEKTVTARLTAQGPDGKEVGIDVPVSLIEEGFSATHLLQAMAVKSVLKDLEEEAEDEKSSDTNKTEVKKKAIALSKSSHVLCKYTSYVAVEQRTDAVTGALKPMHLPLAFVNRENMGSDPYGYYGGGLLRGGGLVVGQCFTRAGVVMAGGAIGGGGPPMPMMACAMAMPSCLASSPPPPSSMMKRGMPPGRRIMTAPPAVAGAPRYLGPPVKMGGAHDMAMADTAMAMASVNRAVPNNDNNMEMVQEHAQQPVLDHVYIVARQKATGEWAWDEFLSTLLGGIESSLNELEAKVRSLDPAVAALDVWATALVLVHLAKTFKEYEEEWEAAAKKGKRWLVRSMGGKGEDVEALLQKAAQVVVV